LELGISPFLAGLPEGFHLASEMLPGLDLAAYQFGLCVRDKTGLRTTSYTAGETEVGAVACLRIIGTRTAWLTALDVAFRERTSTHGLGLAEQRGEITNARRDIKMKPLTAILAVRYSLNNPILAPF